MPRNISFKFRISSPQISKSCCKITFWGNVISCSCVWDEGHFFVFLKKSQYQPILIKMSKKRQYEWMWWENSDQGPEILFPIWPSAWIMWVSSCPKASINRTPQKSESLWEALSFVACPRKLICCSPFVQLSLQLLSAVPKHAEPKRGKMTLKTSKCQYLQLFIVLSSFLKRDDDNCWQTIFAFDWYLQTATS